MKITPTTLDALFEEAILKDDDIEEVLEDDLDDELLDSLEEDRIENLSIFDEEYLLEGEM